VSTEEVVDVFYLAIAGLFWLVIFGLARGCARLQATGESA
jgi:hypothetical protein